MELHAVPGFLRSVLAGQYNDIMYKREKGNQERNKTKTRKKLGNVSLAASSETRSWYIP
jgi:hypothetical protein